MPDYSIIIPAYNEEAHLPATLAAVQTAMQQAAGQGEVVVVDNASTDRTAEIARAAGCRVVFEAHNQIARARNAGGNAAQGGFLVFLDADTELPPALLRQALEALASGGCVGGGAQVAFDRPMPWLATRATAVWNRLTPKFGLAAGCFLFCRRDAFAGMGGFDERFYAGEELFFCQGLKRWGRRQGLAFRVLTEPKVVSSSRKFQWHSRLGMFWMLLPALVPFGIFSRRMCRFWYQRPKG